MSERSRRFVRAGLWSSAAFAFGLIGILAVTAPRAQSADEPAADEPAPAGGMSLPQRTRSPFEPYPADPGALTYESLSDGPVPSAELDPEEPVDPATYALVANETKASVDDAQAWAESHNGHAVSQRWSGYSAKMRGQAQLKRAEYEADLAGIEELGVE
jgi:hypothetical protein